MRLIVGVRSRQRQEELHEGQNHSNESVSHPNEEPGQDSTMREEAGGG